MVSSYLQTVDLLLVKPHFILFLRVNTDNVTCGCGDFGVVGMLSWVEYLTMFANE